MPMTEVELKARWYFWVALWFLLLAANCLLDFSLFFAGEGILGPLAAAEKSTGYAANAVIWFACLWFLVRQLRLDSEQRSRGGTALLGVLRPDDFVAATLQRASGIVFLCLLLLLPVSDLLARYTDITAEQLGKLWAGVLLGSFSLAYFVLTRGQDSGD